jgi:anti-anti-sigma factor
LLVNTDATPSSSIEVEIESASAWGYAGVVTVAGEHDLATAPELARVLESISGDVLVDLSTCTFVDSSVIGVIIARFKELELRDHRLELIAPPNGSIVARVLKISGVPSLITVHDGELGSTDGHASADGGHRAS